MAKDQIITIRRSDFQKFIDGWLVQHKVLTHDMDFCRRSRQDHSNHPLSFYFQGRETELIKRMSDISSMMSELYSMTSPPLSEELSKE